MSDNLGEFVLGLDSFRTEVESASLEEHKRVCLRALQGVVLMSPVGNPALWRSKPPKGYHGGQFRRNWQLSIGQPVSGIASGVDPSGAIAIAEGLLVLHGLRVPFSIAYLQNNLPYALPLEQGHSTQAPQGMVAVTVARLQAERSGGL